MKKIVGPLLIVLAFAACAKAPETSPSTAPAIQRAKSSPGAKVFFIDLKDGQQVSSPLTIKFGVTGIALTPAGEVIDNSGHHHLLIDQESYSVGLPLPAHEKLIHYGKAQTEDTVTLSPGPHTLQLVFAGGNHVPHDPPVESEKIKIEVKP